MNRDSRETITQFPSNIADWNVVGTKSEHLWDNGGMLASQVNDSASPSRMWPFFHVEHFRSFSGGLDFHAFATFFSLEESISLPMNAIRLFSPRSGSGGSVTQSVRQSAIRVNWCN
jgi:hypothetical protein